MNEGKALAGVGYRIAGADSASTVVFSHSLAADKEMWWPQIEALGERAKLVFYDLRGHGESVGSAPPYNIDMLVEDLHRFTELLGADRFSLVGLSLGGMVAQRYAALYGARVERLVLADTAFWTPPENPWEQRIAEVEENGIASIVEATLQRWFTEDFAAANPSVIDRVRRMILRTSKNGYMGCAEAIRNLDNRDILPRINCPTHVIVGAEDKSTPVDVAQGMAERIPGAGLSVIDGAAHLPNVEKNQEFNQILTDFIFG